MNRDSNRSLNTVMRAVKRGGMVLVAGWLGWRVLVTGLAGHYARDDSAEATAAALRWRDDHPQALYRQARSQLERDPDAAERQLRAAAWANPADALIYLTLAERWEQGERRQESILLVEIADVLGPLRSPALIRSATFWLRQERLDRALARWSQLLRTRPETAGQLFPVLLKLAEQPASQPALGPLLAEPPEWWDRFFAYAARNALRAETVSFLYQGRQRRGALPGEAEQRAYLDRLWRDARWLEAYLVWLSGLDESRIRVLGNVYNGGFELPPSGVGFDWRTPAVRGAWVETAPTYGMSGDQALRVRFDGQRVRFQHVVQYLYLEPGRYRLQGKARPDNLRTERGLRWVVRCAPEGPPLVESERFLGSDQWRTFAVEFAVPRTGCAAQILRLELEGRAALDFTVEGEIWFDDLAVVRLVLLE
jgi:tetratricopeptide (TPR) repeat protein